MIIFSRAEKQKKINLVMFGAEHWCCRGVVCTGALLEIKNWGCNVLFLIFLYFRPSGRYPIIYRICLKNNGCKCTNWNDPLDVCATF